MRSATTPTGRPSFEVKAQLRSALYKTSSTHPPAHPVLQPSCEVGEAAKDAVRGGQAARLALRSTQS